MNTFKEIMPNDRLRPMLEACVASFLRLFMPKVKREGEAREAGHSSCEVEGNGCRSQSQDRALGELSGEVR